MHKIRKKKKRRKQNDILKWKKKNQIVFSDFFKKFPQLTSKNIEIVNFQTSKEEAASSCLIC